MKADAPLLLEVFSLVFQGLDAKDLLDAKPPPSTAPGGGTRYTSSSGYLCSLAAAYPPPPLLHSGVQLQLLIAICNCTPNLICGGMMKFQGPAGRGTPSHCRIRQWHQVGKQFKHPSSMSRVISKTQSS